MIAVTVATLAGRVLLGLSIAPARAQIGIPPNCTEEVRIFRSLKYGEFDFCRLHLRYTPWAFDCLRIVVPTCNEIAPHGGRRQLLREGEGTAERHEKVPPHCLRRRSFHVVATCVGAE